MQMLSVDYENNVVSVHDENGNPKQPLFQPLESRACSPTRPTSAAAST